MITLSIVLGSILTYFVGAAIIVYCFGRDAATGYDDDDVVMYFFLTLLWPVWVGVIVAFAPLWIPGFGLTKLFEHARKQAIVQAQRKRELT